MVHKLNSKHHFSIEQYEFRLRFVVSHIGSGYTLFGFILHKTEAETLRTYEPFHRRVQDVSTKSEYKVLS